MEKYVWDKNELFNLLKTKKVLLLKESDNEIINLIESDIEAIKVMLNIAKPSFIKMPYLFYSKKKIKKAFSEQLEDDFTDYEQDVLIRSQKALDSFLVNNNYINISFEDQIELVLNNLPHRKEHEKIFNPDNHILYLNNLDKNYEFNLTDRDYITIQKDETSKGFAALTHEIGHYDEALREKCYRHLLYGEVYSIFYELISNDILKKNKYIDEKEYKDGLNNVCYYNSLDLNSFINIKAFCLGNNIGLKELFGYKMIKEEIYDFTTYVYDLLIAINLYEDYLIDPEKSFYNLNYIIDNMELENEEKVLKAVDIDFDDFTKIKNFQKKIKRDN